MYMVIIWPCVAQQLLKRQNIIQQIKTSGTHPKSVDPKITLKGSLTYPIRYMVQTLPGDFIGVQGDKNTSAEKNIRDDPLISFFLRQG